MARFTDFILQLGANPTTLETLRNDPERIRNAGLSESEMTILMSGDAALIRSAIANELGVEGRIVPFYTVTISLTTVHVSVHVKE
jgi:hypothetical protein